MNERFKKIVMQAQEQAAGNPRLVGTIIKELLHYDILYALHKSKLNKSLVFQGGTALRLCYDSNRYSEDLDFALEGGVDQEALAVFRKVLAENISDRYGLEINLKEPKEKSKNVKVDVKVWCAAVSIKTPTGPKTQKINIEVASIPSYDNRPVHIRANYDGLPSGYKNILMRVETRSEIMADKVVALIGRPYYKARDLWDLKWLMDQNVKPNVDLIVKKVSDYGIEGANAKLSEKLGYIVGEEAQNKFNEEMSRFVDSQTWDELADFGSPSQMITEQVVEYVEGLVDGVDLEVEMPALKKSVGMSP